MTRDGSTAWIFTAPGAITPINLLTGTAGKPIPVATDATNLAVSPDGGTVYLVSYVTTGLVLGAGTVTPIDIKTRTPGHPSTSAGSPTPSRSRPMGALSTPPTVRDRSVTPIDAETHTAGPPIRVAAVYAIKFGLSVNDLATTWAPYLTMSETLKLVAQSFTTPVDQLSCCAA